MCLEYLSIKIDRKEESLDSASKQLPNRLNLSLRGGTTKQSLHQ